MLRRDRHPAAILHPVHGQPGQLRDLGLAGARAEEPEGVPAAQSQDLLCGGTANGDQKVG